MTVSAISRPRDAIGLCGLGERLFAVGGCDDEQRYVNIVECYDTLTNRWTPVTIRLSYVMARRNDAEQKCHGSQYFLPSILLKRRHFCLSRSA